MNTHQVKFSGVAELPGPLDDDKDHIFAGEFEITNTDNKNNNDGSHTYTYKLKPLRIIQQLEGDKKIRLKTKNSNSTRLRGAIWHINPEEEYYDRVMNAIIGNLEGVIKFLGL